GHRAGLHRPGIPHGRGARRIPRADPRPVRPSGGGMSYQQLRDWLLTFVSEVLEVTPAEIDVDATWEAVGVDSATVLVLVADLTASTGLRVRPVEVLDHPSIHALAAHLAAADLAAADLAAADRAGVR